MIRPYAFYKSLRFRFGAVFGSLFLSFLLLIAFFLYGKVKRQFEKSFQQTLQSGAELVLGKTELNPLTVPLPQTGEQFLLIYDNGKTADTLFPSRARGINEETSTSSTRRSIVATRSLETGGRFVIHYSRSADELETEISELRSVLFLYLPIAFVLALIAGYFVSGFLLAPIRRLIDQANQNAREREILLLSVPEIEDELHALTLSLNHMLRRLQEGKRQQNAFFASAAHELRTPLSVMLTGLQVARLENADDNTIGVIDRQVKEVRRLSALVDNLLLMSRLAWRTGDMPDESKSFNLTDVLLENIGMLKTKAAGRNQIFKVALHPPEANFTVRFQENHLGILIRNLLDNAIVHGTEQKSIDVQLEAARGKRLQLMICNDSTAETMDLTRLSKEFEKGDVFREGFGLGLWIVKEIAGMNGAEAFFEFRKPVFCARVTFAGVRE